MHKFEAHQKLIQLVQSFAKQQNFPSEHLLLFDKVLDPNLHSYPRKDIQSGGYVLDTLEASFWCLLTQNNYSETVLTAVNLGRDTDTTAAVTGGLAGILYGEQGIPLSWIAYLARLNDILDLIERLDTKLS